LYFACSFILFFVALMNEDRFVLFWHEKHPVIEHVITYLPPFATMFNKQWTTVASRQVLVDSVESYRESLGHERANVISTAVQKIEDLAERNGENVPANLQAVN
jgi:hypothetical protein